VTEDRQEAAAPDAEESAEFEAGEVETELAAARRQAEEYLDNLRRVAADFDNFRKRVARDADAQAARAGAELVRELLPVLDNLERALDANEQHQEVQVAEGVKLVLQQLTDILGRRGLEPIAAEPGGPFDPHVHEALSTQPSEHAEGTIAAVWQRGYTLGDRVVRPARVVVSGGPPASESEG
jgi:molecular chaperone GrpE